jgi:hypothetical protein
VTTTLLRTGRGPQDYADQARCQHRVYPNSSLAEHLQAALPAVHVVKSLNTAAIEVRADPNHPVLQHSHRPLTSTDSDSSAPGMPVPRSPALRIEGTLPWLR